MRRLSCIIGLCGILIFTSGCEAFVRKFTRKPKNTTADFDVVLAPQQYENEQAPASEQARQSYVFWKSWHVELLSSLENAAGYKRRVHCAKEALSNLRQFAALAKEDVGSVARGYADELAALESLIARDSSGMRNSVYALAAARLLRRIERSFHYSEIEEYVRE